MKPLPIKARPRAISRIPAEISMTDRDRRKAGVLPPLTTALNQPATYEPSQTELRSEPR